MGDAGLVAFRRDDENFAAEPPRDPLENFQAMGVNAVVVGDQNSH
jgi:hypothetical protein